MSKLTLDEAIHDHGSYEADNDTPDSQAAVDDLCLCVHPFSLLAVGERGEARTDKSEKEHLGGEAKRSNDELPKRDCVNRLYGTPISNGRMRTVDRAYGEESIGICPGRQGRKPNKNDQRKTLRFL